MAETQQTAPLQEIAEILREEISSSLLFVKLSIPYPKRLPEEFDFDPDLLKTTLSIEELIRFATAFANSEEVLAACGDRIIWGKDSERSSKSSIYLDNLQTYLRGVQSTVKTFFGKDVLKTK
ncbi:MAG: hypothetical protein MUD10_00435 [Candidatus Pacebacteria bacterium]|jgi:hypothetical protein|nr:hypothetical protein [Candidatus Paceibacterota bacterium]